jgi:hypothetical protein
MPRFPLSPIICGRAFAPLPPDQIHALDRHRLRAAGVRDRERHVTPDTDGLTPYARHIRSEAAHGRAQTRLWLADQLDGLRTEAAELTAALATTGEPAAGDPPLPELTDRHAGVVRAATLRAADRRGRAEHAAELARRRLQEVAAAIEERAGRGALAEELWETHCQRRLAVYQHSLADSPARRPVPAPRTPAAAQG